MDIKVKGVVLELVSQSKQREGKAPAGKIVLYPGDEKVLSIKTSPGYVNKHPELKRLQECELQITYRSYNIGGNMVEVCELVEREA